MALSDDIARLQQAIRNGVSAVTYPNGERVEYQSRREMVQALREMKREAGQLTSTAAPVYPEFSKE